VRLEDAAMDTINTKNDFKIIVIDDNPDIHHDFIKILTTQGSMHALDVLHDKMFGKKEDETSLLPKFSIDTASQGQEGLEYVKTAFEKNTPYSLAFVDIRMPPGWDGIETIKHIWEIDKDIQIVICTAYSDYTWEETVEHLGKKDNLLILKKPFDNISVRQLACALTKKWQLQQDTRRYTSSLKRQVDDRTLSLQQSLSLIKATLESSDEGILVINNEGGIVNYNKKLCALWDIPKSIIDSKSENEVKKFMLTKVENADEFGAWLASLHKTEEMVNLDVIQLKDGKIFDCYSQPQKVNDSIVGRVLNFRDITERITLEKELQHQAQHDALTGLPNRIFLLEKIRESIKDAEEKNSSFSLMFIDLDRFKLINDSLSHAAGDELLKQTAARLQTIMREGDMLARLGGDEFVLLLKDLKSLDDAINKANEFVKIFQTPFTIADRAVMVTASIGVSVYPQDGKSAEELISNADAAMYHVKESGSNNFQFYTAEMNERSLEKLDNEMQLRQALNKNELFLCYQPEFHLEKEKLIAVEVLLRWNHPQRGVLLPIDFIPLAEETGLIVPIGEWAIRTACKQNKKWQEQGFPPIRVAVNISLQQIKQQNLVSTVKSILEETGLKPEYLELELTENIVISSLEVMRVVAELKELGVAISIDDFGTGYSSLSYLKKLPLDRLKIDCSFIQNIKSDKDDEVIIRAIISVAKNLNLEVLAEGVETQNQINFLKKQNCDEIQGYYYSKPLTVEELEDLWRS
jgi:diguanylate cyclase (GGDEF)-like protein